jgi:hypothetical protein
VTIVFVAIGGFPSPTTAADGLGVEARGGMGLSSMLSQWQRDQGFRSGFVPELRPALRLDPSIAAELAFESWFFPRNNNGTGRATFFGGGARWDPRLIGWLTWFLDGHAGVALTGAANRLMFDLGTGLDFWVARGVAVGPFVRYGQVVGHGSDPRFWAAGLGATVTWGSGGDEPPALGATDPKRDERQREWERERQRERQAPRQRDRDHDGVADEIDICPDEPAGSRPDPTMLGCPQKEQQPEKPVAARPAEPDSDGDGIPDRDDLCPDRPFGKNPDPLALGCPLSDRDHDGIPDIFDACPDKRGKPSPKVRKNGCAVGAARARLVPSNGSDPSA